MNKLGLETDYFIQFVPPDVFNEKLSNSDVVIAPVNFNYRSGVVKEKFTYTKGTGTFSDMIQYAKPAIVPNEYNITPEFKNCFLNYNSSEDLSILLKSLLLSDTKIEKLKKETTQIISKYTLPQMQKMAKVILDGFIN